MWGTTADGRGRFGIACTTVAALLAVGGCGSGVQSPSLGPVSEFSPAVPLGLDAVAPVPPDNLLTLAKVELGRRLFFDPLLSRDHTLSCASCHRPELAFADTLPLSPGVLERQTARNAPTLLNRAYGRSFFWDGRTASLEEAVLMPIDNPDELGLGTPELVARLRRHRGYRAFFRKAFGDAPVSGVLVGRALASYLRTLRSGDAPVDRYLAGDADALTETMCRGRALFLGKAGCADCHSGPNFTDERFHNTGVSWGPGDPGRSAITGQEADRGRFKTPTLREIARTPPYMHDGSLSSLEEVIEFYDRGGGANPYLDSDIRPLRLTPAEKKELIAFLRSLRQGPDLRPAGPVARGILRCAPG